jgi:hypothetical protein
VLLAHLLHAGMLNSKPENVATEALGYVLGKSAEARAALLSHPAIAVLGLHDDLKFSTQVHGDDSAIPDLVGIDALGRQILIIEAKFWAGLTENQPVTYLKRLPEKTNAALLVVAPASRFETLWSELQRRCLLVGMPFAPKPLHANETRAASVGSFHHLVMVSWRSLLDRMAGSLGTAAESGPAADVVQLHGLCDQMDSEAFLPLRSDELSIVSPGRILQFSEMLKDLKDRVISEQIALPWKGSNTLSTDLGKWGYFLLIGTAGAGIYVDLGRWHRLRATPFWLEVWGPVQNDNFRPTLAFRQLLSPLEAESPPRLLVDRVSQGGRLTVPLFPRLGVERDVVLEDLIEQVRKVAVLLSTVKTS